MGVLPTSSSAVGYGIARSLERCWRFPGACGILEAVRSLGALGVVTALITLALMQPWSLLSAGDGKVPTTHPVRQVSASAELEESRRCLRPSIERAGLVCVRISERRGGVETRLGKVREPSLR